MWLAGTGLSGLREVMVRDGYPHCRVVQGVWPGERAGYRDHAEAIVRSACPWRANIIAGCCGLAVLLT
jgi:hypothetical protein